MDSRMIGIILVLAVACWAVYSVLQIRKEKKGKSVPK